MSDADKAYPFVVSLAQTMLLAERDKAGITPALIAEKVKFAAVALASTYPEGIDQEAAIAELIRRFSHWIGKDAALHDTEGHEPWLVATRKKDWRYWQRYQGFLERKLSVDVVAALDDSTDDILGLLEDPGREGSWDRRGLVVGHVQSGKTGNYSGLVCKAADAGYKIVIVLAGLHNNLRSQTRCGSKRASWDTRPRPTAIPANPSVSLRSTAIPRYTRTAPPRVKTMETSTPLSRGTSPSRPKKSPGCSSSRRTRRS